MTRKPHAVLAAFLVALLVVPHAAAQAPRPVALDRVVFLGGNLSGEQLLLFTTTLAAGGHPGVPLLDVAKVGPYTKAFLQAFQPEMVLPVGTFPQGVADLDQRLGIRTGLGYTWERGPPEALWQALFPRADAVVVCPAEPRGQMLQAACLSGVLKAPLFLTHGDRGEAAQLRRWLGTWQAREVHAVGEAADLCQELDHLRVVKWPDEDAVAREYLRLQLRNGPIRTLVLANPDDAGDRGSMSALAPWVALQKRAALVLTRGPEAVQANAALRAALQNKDLSKVEHLILVAGLKAVQTESRVNPAVGRDSHIEMEPFTPTGREPFTLATGRLFHEEPGVVLLALARQRLLGRGDGPRKALIVSNPGGGLPLLETFSRNTAQEFRNAGYQTTALFEDQVTREKVRALMPRQDIFLWEGHYRTMVDEFGLPRWTEALQPQLVFLQSCLALNEPEGKLLLNRGACAVVGSATRTYSGSGGAFTLAFFDALLYEDRTLGEALRQAKNYLLAYSLLKEKRLGEAAKLNGANVRSSWAFTLWGDPTLRLPRPERPTGALPVVRAVAEGNNVTLTIPTRQHDKVVMKDKYQVQMWPNARLAGLLTRNDEEEEGRLIPLFFAEVALPRVPPGTTPRLASRLPENRWVFNWDARRQVGYLLVVPRSRDIEEGEIRFQVRRGE